MGWFFQKRLRSPFFLHFDIGMFAHLCYEIFAAGWFAAMNHKALITNKMGNGSHMKAKRQFARRLRVEANESSFPKCRILEI